MGQLYMVDPGTRTPPGAEQMGDRPYLVIANPAEVHTLRYPLLMLVPLTRSALPTRALYPRLRAGAGGLTAESTALLDQLVTLDPKRIRRYLGTLSEGDYAPVRSGLEHLFCRA